MKALPWLLPAILPLLPITDTSLVTLYREGTTYRVTRETTLKIETTHFSMEIDGEEVERSGERDMGSSSSRSVVHVDDIHAASGGRPMEVMRSFETLTGESERFGQDVSLDARLAGVSLFLTDDGRGEVDVEVDSGGPVDDEALEGHVIRLELDALLPIPPVGTGDVWSVSDEDLFVALGWTADAALFGLPDFDLPSRHGSRGDGAGGEGGAGRGDNFLRRIQWGAEGSLTGRTEDVDGVTCRVIEVTADASASLEGRRGRGRPRGFSPSKGTGLEPATAPVRGTEIMAGLEGKLYIAVENSYPVRFEVRITFTIEIDNEFDRNGSTVRMHRTQDGVFEQTVAVEKD